MEIYRFRTAYALLDGYQELENQQIYFATSEELNNPMEGFRDFIWRGDEIIWRNLLKNYLFCLDHIYAMTLVAADRLQLTAKDVPLHNYPLAVPAHKLLLLEKIRKKFFSRPLMDNFPAQLTKRTSPIRRNELLNHLMFVHKFALKAIEEVYQEEGMILAPLFPPDEKNLEEAILKAGNFVELCNQLEAAHAIDKVDAVEIFCQLTNTFRQSTPLTASGVPGAEKMYANRIFLINDFIDGFVDRLEVLIYPDWYSASFLTNCKNSAIWGHYGDNHRGICLIYQPKETGDALGMDIHVATGANSRGPTFGWREQPFRKVHYDRQHVEIDFFRSLGRSPASFLDSTWYRGENGDLSECGRHLHENTEDWRKGYWENFENSLVIKIKEWEDEQEYRLTLDGNFHDYTDKDSRKLAYKFEDLKGLIFGIKTAQADKMKVIKIIKQKCAEAGRKDFKIYQAYYSRLSKQIERQELSLLKFA